jgi:hypothetical protein
VLLRKECIYFGTFVRKITDEWQAFKFESTKDTTSALASLDLEWMYCACNCKLRTLEQVLMGAELFLSAAKVLISVQRFMKINALKSFSTPCGHWGVYLFLIADASDFILPNQRSS